MLKILHTADLHLGKSLYEQSLAADQAFMLDRLVELLAEGGYHALVIAGDVYDRSIPSPDAVTLFGDFLNKARRLSFPPEIIVIPGNHDSSVRLGFGRELFASLGIHFVTRVEDAFKPIILRGSEGDSCACFPLPFLTPGCLGETVLRTQAELAAEAAPRLEAARKDAVSQGADYTLLAAHLFASGGKESDSERVFIGGAEQVDINPFAGFDYIALGHLHRFQHAGANGFYSGSPLAYSFGEAGAAKNIVSVTFDKKNDPACRAEPSAIQPLRALSRLEGNFGYFFNETAWDEKTRAAKNDYLEITLKDGITENALALLRRNFPNILAVRQDSGFTAGSGAGLSGNEQDAIRERNDTASDFSLFLAELYGSAEKDIFADKEKLFAEMLAGAELAEGEL